MGAKIKRTYFNTEIRETIISTETSKDTPKSIHEVANKDNLYQDGRKPSQIL